VVEVVQRVWEKIWNVSTSQTKK